MWFTPGTIHRLVNTSGDLEIFVIMANAGLPEAGRHGDDLPRPEVLADPDAYRGRRRPGRVDDDGVRRRQDLAVGGFSPSRTAVARPWPSSTGRPPPCSARRAETGAPCGRTAREAEAERVGEQLARSPPATPAPWPTRSVHRRPPATDRTIGCCGTLGKYLPV